jgi:tetratricopeptide (TPR) repeat protein
VTTGAEEIIDTEGLPDWLQEVQEVEEEALEPSEPSPEEEFVAEEELTLEGELPDWLRQVQDETQEVSIDEFDLYGEEEAEPVGEGEVIVAEELPDWLRGLEEEPEAAEAPPAPAAAEAAPAPEPVQEVAAPTPEPEPVPEPVVTAAPVPAPAAVEEPKPQPRPAPAGLPDWLKKLREGEREEEKTAAAMPAPRPAPALATVQDRSVGEIKTEEQAQDLPTDAEERLKLAREARDEGNLEDAIQVYDTLVSSGVYLHQIIEDMQQAIKSYPSNYLLYQLMGDAMMREGRLHSALEAYRQALARL